MIAVRDVARYPLLCLPSGSGLRAVSDAVWESAGITPKIALEANDPQVLAHLATRGLGMAILPAPFARTCAELLHPVEISSPRLRGRLALTWKAVQPVSPATRALVGHSRAVFASRVARDAAARSA